jgi:hypothetical protein
MVTKQKAAAAIKEFAVRAGAASRRTAQRIFLATDAALVEAGQAAKRRQRIRGFKQALRVTAMGAAATAATAGIIMATRAVQARRGNGQAAKR